MKEQYQDYWVKGERISKGVRECEKRYEIIRNFCKQYTRPFTVLDIGANVGYFSIRLAEDFPQSVAVAIEGDSYWDEFIDLAARNDNPRLIGVNKIVTPEDLETLAGVEHFDVVIMMSCVHHILGSWSDPNSESYLKALKIFQSLGDNFIIETPVEPQTCGAPWSYVVRTTPMPSEFELIGTGESHLVEGQVRPIFLSHQNRTSLITNYLGSLHTMNMKITGDFNNKTVSFPRKNENRNWISGINLMTWLAWNKPDSCWPKKEYVADLVCQIPTINHRDIAPWNAIFGGNKITWIDANDPEHPFKWQDKPRMELIATLIKEGILFGADLNVHWLERSQSLNEKFET